MVEYVAGNRLNPRARADALGRFVHRHTGNHKPAWARGIWKDGKPYPVQFLDDSDWLANSRFAVTKDGRLSRRETLL
jgi:hypothetical protein